MLNPFWTDPLVALALGALSAIALYLMVARALGKGSWGLIVGKDGRLSLSLFQWFLWSAVVFIGFVAVVLRRDFDLGVTLTKNIFIAMGAASATAIVAKGITSSQVESARVSKSYRHAPRPADLFQDDDGKPELSRVQLFGWTIIGVATFLVLLARELATANADLPEIDDTLMVLMGLGQAAYVGKKLTLSSSPRITAIAPLTAPVGTKVTLRGVSLGGTSGPTSASNSGASTVPPAEADAPGGLILIDGAPTDIYAETWTSEKIEFVLPRRCSGRPAWADRHVAKVSIEIGGKSSNEIALIVLVPALGAVHPPMSSGEPFVLSGSSLRWDDSGSVIPPASRLIINGRPEGVTIHSWTAEKIRFSLEPGKAPPSGRAILIVEGQGTALGEIEFQIP